MLGHEESLLGSTPSLMGNGDNLGTCACRTTFPYLFIYYIGLIPVLERPVAAWWNSWWTSFHDTLPILIYYRADGHIPHPPAAPLLSCGSSRKRGCRVGKTSCAHCEGRTQSSGSTKVHVKPRRADNQLFKIII